MKPRNRRRMRRAEQRVIYGAEQPAPPLETYERCRTRREGDEIVCFAAGCGRRWGVDEPPPNCPRARRE